jgi:hypothetical protein
MNLSHTFRHLQKQILENRSNQLAVISGSGLLVLNHASVGFRGKPRLLAW